MSSSAAQARFLRLLLGAVGAATACTGAFVLPGCGAKVAIDRSSGAGGGGGSGGGSQSSSASSSSGGPVDCKPHLVSSNQTSPNGTCADSPDVFFVNINCFEAPPAPATCADYTDDCILSTYNCGFIEGGTSIACGPQIDGNGACCYTIIGDCAVGRPFTVDGHARLGALDRGEGWRAELAPDTASLDGATRATLAEAWGREALFEHASVASFARFALQLLALGAPADLVADAQRALADEIDHARVCLGLASAYAGAALRPGPLPIDGALTGCSDAASIAASLAREGCVAETVAALLVQRAHDDARDPVVKAALGRIAEQEAAHALLAWRALAWMLGAGNPGVAAAVAAVFAEAEAHTSLGAIVDAAGDATALRAHGYVPVDERRARRSAAWSARRPPPCSPAARPLRA